MQFQITVTNEHYIQLYFYTVHLKKKNLLMGVDVHYLKHFFFLYIEIDQLFRSEEHTSELQSP